MNFQKKFYIVVLLLALLLSIGSINVLASNHGDEPFTFNFPLGTDVDYTNKRPKENSTSAYMKLGKVLGATNPSYIASVVDENYNNFSKTWYYSFDSSDINKGRYLSNYAFEDEGSGVQVRIKADRGPDRNGFYGSGVWSPDSI